MATTVEIDGDGGEAVSDFLTGLSAIPSGAWFVLFVGAACTLVGVVWLILRSQPVPEQEPRPWDLQRDSLLT